MTSSIRKVTTLVTLLVMAGVMGASEVVARDASPPLAREDAVYLLVNFAHIDQDGNGVLRYSELVEHFRWRPVPARQANFSSRDLHASIRGHRRRWEPARPARDTWIEESALPDSPFVFQDRQPASPACACSRAGCGGDCAPRGCWWSCSAGHHHHRRYCHLHEAAGGSHYHHHHGWFRCPYRRNTPSEQTVAD